MNASSIAQYMRDHYSRAEYMLLTLTSCALLLERYVEDNNSVPSEVEIVAEALNTLRESLDEHELLTVSIMMAEIERLGDEDGSPKD